MIITFVIGIAAAALIGASFAVRARLRHASRRRRRYFSINLAPMPAPEPRDP